ncbi:MAG: GNAT family N-acetyltransferase [Janthinobacterium lividum]
MPLTYHLDRLPSPEQVIDLYQSAGLHRPLADPARIAQMYAHANLVASAWQGELLVGVARSLTDFCYCCYLADLAVRATHQRQGIGRHLLHLTRERIGPATTLVLVAAADARDYYPKLGMTPADNAFLIRRTE